MGYLEDAVKEFKEKQRLKFFDLEHYHVSLRQYFVCDSFANYEKLRSDIMKLYEMDERRLWEDRSKFGFLGRYLIESIINGKVVAKIISGTNKVFLCTVPDCVNESSFIIPSNPKIVKFNSTVVLSNLNKQGHEDRYYLIQSHPIVRPGVAPTIDDLDKIGTTTDKGTTITSDSPVGKIILNKKIGYEFFVDIESSGTYEKTKYRIKDIITY